MTWDRDSKPAEIFTVQLGFEGNDFFTNCMLRFTVKAIDDDCKEGFLTQMIKNLALNKNILSSFKTIEFPNTEVAETKEICGIKIEGRASLKNGLIQGLHSINLRKMCQIEQRTERGQIWNITAVVQIPEMQAKLGAW